MNPIFALWWLMHRNLIDPEIMARLSKRQKQLVSKHAVAQVGWKLGVTAIIVSVAGLVLFLEPLMWFSRMARQYFGPLSFLAPCAIGLALGVPLWWFARHRIRKSIYRDLREFQFDVCPVCGYWLRGLGSDVETCPECGKAREPMPGLSKASESEA
jgi:hypothetical protein